MIRAAHEAQPPRLLSQPLGYFNHHHHRRLLRQTPLSFSIVVAIDASPARAPLNKEGLPLVVLLHPSPPLPPAENQIPSSPR